jgi:hypothetical protein
MGIFPCGGRIPVVTMVWVVSRFRHLRGAKTSINNDWSHKRSPRWRGSHHVSQPAHQLIEYRVLRLLIREKKIMWENLRGKYFNRGKSSVDVRLVFYTPLGVVVFHRDIRATWSKAFFP